MTNLVIVKLKFLVHQLGLLIPTMESFDEDEKREQIYRLYTVLVRSITKTTTVNRGFNKVSA